ncbi:hypothetical protein E9531_06815 [Lampropedia puyangensis]|uniref:Cobalamin biosynthesis protein CobD n=1 Tax=Lampropedia puyangensis TaxID=1330072 RepID=A0A4V4GRM4_9BURK|nr:regulatory signaling modulator protein AmpE [Lampropedia puyangensis]THU02806.1 hypothetical protein E9531_06815 [Lampropedia puyangensis]
MSVFSLFCALLLDQFRPLQSHHRVYAVMRAMARRLRQHLDADTAQQAWLIWALVVVIPAILVWLVYWLAGHFLGGFFAFLCSLMVLYACLDFRAFGLHFTDVRNAVNTGDLDAAGDALERWCTARGQEGECVASHAIDAEDMGSGAMKISLEHMHRYVFGVFTAFLLSSFVGLGPLGAVLFRSAAHAYRFWVEQDEEPWTDNASPALVIATRMGWQAINWLPARVTALMFAAVGRYDDALSAWRTYSLRCPGDGDALVLATGVAAMGMAPNVVDRVVTWSPCSRSEGESFERDTTDEAEALSRLLHALATMIWRVLVVWLLICLVIGLIDAVL